MGLKPGGTAAEPLRPRLRVVDVERGRVVDELVYEADPAHVPGPEAHQEFTAASFLADGRLIQPAHTELLWIDRRLRVLSRVSDPWFHGMHSATEGPDGRLVVTCAGLDSVLELDRLGRVERERPLGLIQFRGDARKLDHDALKPHAVHPNFASWVDGELWVTAFETSEARAPDTGRRIALPEAFPHDGRRIGRWLWFTQVVGRVIAVDPVTLERRLELDLRDLDPGERRRGSLGWCRGVEVVGSRLFVGVTMLRATRHREVLRQIVLGARLPTRIVEVDLDTRRIVREIAVGNEAGGTIYSVLAEPGSI